MPYQQRWYVDKRVLLVKMWGDLDLEEITRSSIEMEMKLKDGIPLMHIVIDDAHVGKVPASLGQLRNIVSGANPSVGWVLLAGQGSPIKNFLVSMIAKILRTNIRREPTLEQAIAFLKERDISIPWDEAHEETFSPT